MAPYEEATELLAEFERIEHINETIEMDTVKRLYDRLQRVVQKMIVALGDLGDQRCGDLLKILQHFDRQTTPLFEPALSIAAHPILVPLESVRPDMMSLVGHKAANLSIIASEIGLPVPRGFILTARAFDRFMEENDLPGVIDAYQHDLNMEHYGVIEERCEAIRRLILQGRVPDDVEQAIKAQMADWQSGQAEPLYMAVRSTAIGEDTEISFAGQFATLLNVPPSALVAAYKEVLASKYTPGATLYRMRYGLDDRTTPMAVMVMAMIPARASGVVYTRNPSLPEQSDLQISAIYGLGEYLMSGDATPHALAVCRRTGQVTTRHVAEQTHWMRPLPEGGTRLEPMSTERRGHAPIDEATARCLADWGTRLEKHFGAPQDVEWALDTQRRPYILQSRPLGLDGPSVATNETNIPLERLTVIHSGGRKACSGIVSGRIYRADQALTGETIPADSILVIPKAAPEYAPIVGLVRGVIAAKGSAASHLASVAREFGVPMVVDTGRPADQWIPGLWVTLHADTATVYEGRIRQTDGGPLPSVADPFETPVRRRLRALSSRITHHLSAAALPQASTGPEPSTLYDIIGHAHRNALDTLHNGEPKIHKSIRTIRWSRDNAAADFMDPSDASTPESDHGSPSLQGHSVGADLLYNLWSGLSGGHPGENHRALPLKLEGFALLGEQSFWAVVPFGTQQAVVEAIQTFPQQNIRIRLRIQGGTDPYYKRCLRTRLIAGALEELGFRLRINGALLDASLDAPGNHQGRDILRWAGRLLVFSLDTDHALVGPWVIEALRNTFLAAETPPPLLGADLPATLAPLVGNWRQATLNGRSVVVQDGAAVGDIPHPPLTRLIGTTKGDYRAFLKQLYRDHFYPLTIAESDHIRDGQIDMAINLLTGCAACAGGVVFGYRDVGHHFMVGLDAHQRRIVLYEFIHGRRFKRLRKRYPVHTDRWYDISLWISGLSAHLHINGTPLMAYTADRPIAGRVGMWAAADTVAVFDGLSLLSGTRREIPFNR
jgi:pyruvate,water dikinase